MRRPLLSLTLLITSSFATFGCSFISKRIESREKKEYSETADKPVPGTTDEQLTSIRIKDYERQLKSNREKELYSKLLPWFRDQDEKLDYLSLP